MSNSAAISVNPVGQNHGSRLSGGGLDELSRLQVSMAARLLRSIAPSDGEIEITLHEIARRLEQIAEAEGPASDCSSMRM